MSTAPESTLTLLLARAWTALHELAEYQPANLAEVHQLLEATAANGTRTGSLAEAVAEILDRAGRNQHLTDLPDQGDLVQAATAYVANAVIAGMGGAAIGEALDAIQQPWDARTADEFLHAHDVEVDERPATPAPAVEAEVDIDAELAEILTGPATWDDGPVIPKIPNPRPPSGETSR